MAVYNRARGFELRTTVNKSRQQVVKVRSAVSPLVQAVSEVVFIKYYEWGLL